MSKIILTGYHGTDASNKTSILENNFNISKKYDEWLGDGVYFFVDGKTASVPKNNALKWAIAQAYDKDLKKYTYDKLAIFESEIEVEEKCFLDLTESEGLKGFNKLRNQYIQKIVESRTYLEKGSFKDGYIINEARKNAKIPIEVAKGDFYFKFANERRFNVNFRVPNVTILSVFQIDRIKNTKCILEKKFRTR